MDVGWMDEKMEEGEKKKKKKKEAEEEITTGLNEAGERKEPRCEAEQTHRNGVAVKLPHLPSTSSESVPANPDFARISLFPFPRVRSSYQITWTVIKDHCNMSSRSFNVKEG